MSTVYGGLTPADKWRLKVARQNFIEAAQDDFDRGGRDFIDRTSGKRYRVVRFDPTLSEDPRGDTGVELFYVTDDDWLVYLKPVGATGRSRTVNLGRGGEGMNKPADHDRRLAEIAARKDRFEIPRSWSNERDWRVHLHEARKQRLVSQPLDGVPDVVPTHLPVSFGLRDDPQRARQSRVAANLILEKYGIR